MFSSLSAIRRADPQCKWQVHLMTTFEFSLNCHIWHFCHSCTKLTSQGFTISKKKIASTGYWTHNTNPTIRIPAPLPTQPICQSMPASNFQTLLKSCSIKPEMIKVQFMNLLSNRCLGDWVVKGAGNLRVGLVLWVQYPVEVIFFCWFWNPVMSILYKNDRNVRSGN